MIWDIVFIVAAMFLSVAFSAVEGAVFALTPGVYLFLSEDRGKEGMGRLDTMLASPSGLLSAVFLCNTFADCTIACFTYYRLEVVLDGPWAALLFIAVFTPLLFVLTEVAPKVMGARYTRRILASFTDVLYFFYLLTIPVVMLLENMACALSSLITRSEGGSEVEVPSGSDIDGYLTLGMEEGIVGKLESRMLDGVFRFSEKLVREIMVSRTRMDALEVGASREEVFAEIRRSKRSRYPVYRGTLDDVVGVLYVKDLLRSFTHHRSGASRRGEDEGGFDLGSVLREAFFVPEVVECYEVFEQMRRKGVTMAVVVDEYGGTAGMVTMEDLLEEIVGDIEDEHDAEKLEDELLERKGDVWRIGGGKPLEEVFEALGIRAVPDFECETTGGFVFGALGRLPSPGDSVEFGGWRFEVVKVERRRIALIEARPVDTSGEGTHDA